MTARVRVKFDKATTMRFLTLCRRHLTRATRHERKKATEAFVSLDGEAIITFATMRFGWRWDTEAKVYVSWRLHAKTDAEAEALADRLLETLETYDAMIDRTRTTL